MRRHLIDPLFRSCEKKPDRNDGQLARTPFRTPLFHVLILSFLLVLGTAFLDILPASAQDAGAQDAGALRVVSFNIQFLGHFKHRRDTDLADMLAPFDIIAVEELVAPPVSGIYPDGTHYRADREAASFVKAMEANGFTFLLSDEDTGAGETNHKATPATEWSVVFYKPARVMPDYTLPHGFLADDRTANPDFDRVPFAFPFKRKGGGADFILIPVHLRQGDRAKDSDRRRHELAIITIWADKAEVEGEGDVIILGDMNFKDCSDMESALPSGFETLNAACIPTNTNPNGPRPYDQVFFRKSTTSREMGMAPGGPGAGFAVVDLVGEMKKRWPQGQPGFPGEPYDHNGFRVLYSDHDPVAFTLSGMDRDDD